MPRDRRPPVPPPASEDVRRVLSQVVEASCNHMARSLCDRLRALIQDESTRAGDLGGRQYVSGYNDALRAVISLLNDRLERQGLVEQTAHACAAIVEVR